jgi:hypothetical protein
VGACGHRRENELVRRPKCSLSKFPPATLARARAREKKREKRNGALENIIRGREAHESASRSPGTWLLAASLSRALLNLCDRNSNSYCELRNALALKWDEMRPGEVQSSLCCFFWSLHKSMAICVIPGLRARLSACSVCVISCSDKWSGKKVVICNPAETNQLV